MLVGISYWIKHKENLNFKNGIVFFLLVHLIYFSHLFIFMVFGLVIFVLLVFDIIHHTKENKKPGKRIAWKLFHLICTFSIALLLVASLLFTTEKFTGNETSRLAFNELIKWLIDLRGSITYNYPKEAKINHIFTILLVGLILINILLSLKNKKKVRFQNHFHNPWLWISLILFFLYFIVPNHLPGRGGHMSVRFIIVFFIFFSLWLSTRHFPAIIKNMVILISILTTLLLLSQRISVFRNQSREAKEIVGYEQSIPKNSIILPINYSSHWLQLHYSNYLGINRSQVILENYEASVGTFPLKWNWQEMPELLLGKTNKHDICLNWPNGNNKPEQPVEYIFVWGTKDKKENKCTKQIDHVLKNHYQEIRETKNARLFKLKSR